MAMRRWAGVLGVTILCLLGPVRAEESGVEVQVVDAMNTLFGVHPGFRAFHAKGIVAQGTFTAAPAGSALSKAAIFDGNRIPVTVRFSDNGGFPAISDGSADASPRGMALKFHLPDGSETDMVTNSFKVFPVATAADLRDLFLAAAASGPDVAKPTPIERFVAGHPNVAVAAGSLGTPDSFLHEQYRGLNAFQFVNRAGERQAVRIVIEPEQVVHLDAADAARRAPNFLMDDLPQRLASGPATFHLQAQLAVPGDPTNDPSRPWPEDRKRAELGELSIDRVVADSGQAEKTLLFLPGQLPDGIEPSDDPMIDVRNAAYAVSFSRRTP